MNHDVILRLTGRQKRQLTDHLFPGDGLEAVALLLCGRRRGTDRHCLSVMDVILVPHAQCQRRPDRITWPTTVLESLLARAADDGLAVVKVHSHAGGFSQFSEVDDRSDAEFFRVAANWAESDDPHGSVVTLPCGRMFGRVGTCGAFHPMTMISVAGDMIEYWPSGTEAFVPDFAERHAQVLGDGTFERLRQLRIAVIGCSGTGSPTVEQLFRLGVGELVLVDPDTIGPENLNRIYNSQGRHAQTAAAKVTVLADAIEDAELGTTVITLNEDLCTPRAVEAAAACDLIFGCVDSVFARHLINKMASTYCIPFIDVGVGLKADGVGGIAQATGAVHYLQPDGSSLLSRRVFSLDDIRIDILRRTDPDEYASQLEVGYIKGAEVGQPAVIAINTIFAGYGVMEMLCRLHDIRFDDNAEFATQRWSLSGGFATKEPDGDRCTAVSRNLGRGDMRPLLGLPELSYDEARSHADS